MKKISIKNIIEFREKSDRAKKKFAADIKLDKEKIKTEGGGDYWVSCLSAISNSYKSNELQSIIDRKEQLEEKYGKSKSTRTKIMYKRNIDILYNFIDLDLKRWRPSKKVKFIKKHKEDFVLNIKGLQVQASPHHVFTFEKNDVIEVGAIWFIAKLDGFRKDELGMFTDILHTYLKTHFSKDYNLSSKYCIAVDVFKNFDVNYSQLEKGEISPILNSTLDEIKRLM